MLDQETKRKIDSARNILVGKVPDPKAQVEQITTALIYKFMDDMDKENEEVGLKTQFFIGEWKKFSWTKLLDNKLSGQERLDLYVQAITNMSKNPHIPQLFRDIFKGAFLPYNDPRTLSLFLKEINEFNYEHSEDLGDAFEYLLSVLGSQGDAGQFRTPRHIIDFIVKVVDPKKNETILDPACGTAGFLISAYKYILKTNQEKPLTPDEKLKLMNNLVGYDISPDMVKLALVNMYLHGSPNPRIYEYDTLSSENRWDETFDVILANPPFMTPKGGIRPHKRFSIQANRAEVLFVDYIVNHLNLKGRAGIIVPEGIIFQTANAYKTLRKNLVEDGLVAVISLPSGVFQPYSGVKTSILFFDNEIAKTADNLLFIKITNDGFDLGAQRREIDKNDLPTALKIIKKYRQTLSDKDFTEEEKEIAQVVAREKIIESGDYNLTGERYREVETFTNQKWPMVELGEVCEIESGSRQKGGALSEGIPSVGGEQINLDGSLRLDKMKYISEEHFETMKKGVLQKGDVLVVKDGATTGKVGYFNNQFKKGAVNEHVFIFRAKDKIIPYFLFKTVQSNKFQNILQGYIKGIIGGISLEVKEIKIPLPPLSVQKEIVEKIEVKQNAIDAAKEVIKNLERERRYFGESLRRIEGVEWVELGEIVEILDNKRRPITKSERMAGVFPYYGATGVLDYVHDYIFDERLVLIGEDGAKWDAGDKTAFIAEGKYWVNNHAHVVRPIKEKVIDVFLVAYLNSIDLSPFITGVTVPKLNQEKLKLIKIPLPPLEIQQKFVAEAKEEQKIIDANKRLIEIMEGKIKANIKFIYG